MLFYHGKHVRVNYVGERLVRVECGRCGCEYFYELTRIGSGGETAPYNIGVGRAKRSAQRQAQRDLERRLSGEAELVPCPRCNWINDDLVQGYRLGWYRSFGAAAVIVGVCGTVVSMVSAWFLSIGPAPDRGAVRYVLIGGPLISISVSVGIVLLHIWLRSRIQPNRDYPFAPKVPPGTPPALVKDDDGKLAPAVLQQPPPGHSGDSCDFQVGRHQLPLVCCGCLRPTTTEYGYQTPTLIVPRCKDCARFSNRAFWCIFSIVAACGTILGCASLVPLKLESAEYWIFSFCSLAVSLCFAAFIAWKATTPVTISSGDRSRGVVRLRFRNPEYGQIVAQHLNG